jgi:hypothetical protein
MQHEFRASKTIARLAKFHLVRYVLDSLDFPACFQGMGPQAASAASKQAELILEMLACEIVRGQKKRDWSESCKRLVSRSDSVSSSRKQPF